MARALAGLCLLALATGACADLSWGSFTKDDCSRYPPPDTKAEQARMRDLVHLLVRLLPPCGVWDHLGLLFRIVHLGPGSLEQS